jgi:hypothetical protein
MNIRDELTQALDTIKEPPDQPPEALLAVAARRARTRRLRRSGLGVAALLGVGTLAISATAQGWFADATNPSEVSVAAAGEFPTGEVPAEFDDILRACGAMVDPADNRVYLADGAKVLRKVDDVVDPAVARHSTALEVRLSSGQVRWVGVGWEGTAVGAGCGGPSQPDLSTPVEERTFDGYVKSLWDGRGMKLK